MSKFITTREMFVTSILVFIMSVHVSNAQWVQMSNGIGASTGVYSLAYSGNSLFAGTQNGVYVSTDNGTSWTQTLLNNRTVYSLAVSGNNIFAGCENDYGLYLSLDYGVSWTQTSLDHRFVFSLLIDGSSIFAGTEYNNAGMGVYLSTNNGTSWTQTSFNNRSVRSLAVHGNSIFAGTPYDGIYLSPDHGATWTQTSLNNRAVYSLAVNGNNIFAGTIGLGVYLSTNDGTSWTQTSLDNQTIYTFATSGTNNIFVGTYQYGVFVSTNNGASWDARSEGFPNGTIVYSLRVFNGYIFASTNGAGSLYRRPLGELVNVQTISNEAPQQFSLSQNYPNPFNPITTIGYRIQEKGFVLLKVYNVLGSEVASLVDGVEEPGIKSVRWDATGVSSGVYFYRLRAGAFTETMKLMLLR